MEQPLLSIGIFQPPQAYSWPFWQVLLYLEKLTALPMTIYIKRPANAKEVITEIVEETATMEEVMVIMQNLDVVAAWKETAEALVSIVEHCFVTPRLCSSSPG